MAVRSEAVPRQPKQRHAPAALAPAPLPPPSPSPPPGGARFGGAKAGSEIRRRRHEAPGAGTEANGAVGGSGGGANAGGAARAAAPGPAARLGVQVACGTNHRGVGGCVCMYVCVCRGEGRARKLGPAAPYHAARGEGRGGPAHLVLSPPPHLRLPHGVSAAPCRAGGAGAAAV